MLISRKYLMCLDMNSKRFSALIIVEKALSESRKASDELDRIPIEGKFGEGKRRFSLSKIMSKPPGTSKAAIAMAFLVMNIEKWLKSALFCFFFSSKKLASIRDQTSKFKS
ncbi:hypothetical protein EPICR_130016 [Candidatus Desulfarcum epimagneticum]|uniref:Transposase DDE domain-containing protein n=1 Tax=uncultured Desulfobacteraceae bacterium TaxID=218296 RepID=A0A484HFC0_9BACT|nr:hypothetical protein EPICR_130016 [uncultured Desulfobacteraceae bacterium]